jgi:hypothetical protein
VRGPTSASNDDAQTTRGGSGRIFKKQIGRAVRAYHSAFMRDTKFAQHGGRVLHGFPIALTSHDHANNWIWLRSHVHEKYATKRKSLTETVVF